METRLCKKCREPIPKKRRSDATFCSDEHGWTYRNQQKAKENKDKNEKQRRLDRNHIIIKNLYKRGKTDVSVEALELFGFDFELYTNVVKTNPTTKTSVVKVYEYQITFRGPRCKIEKLLL